MFFSIVTLIIALLISAVSAYYSIIGLTAIFAAAFWPIVIMGSALEAGKICATLWLHYYWERASFRIKAYLVPAVCILMFLTSMGVFGYLSGAHSSQTMVSGDVTSQVVIFDEKIKTQRDNVEMARKALTQMDAAVDQVMGRTTDETGALKSTSIRRSQAKERSRLQTEIDAAQKEISKLQEQRVPIAAQVRKVNAEVGPIRYIAALIYGDNPEQNLLESAVRWVIIIIVSVFDPLAIVLLLAATTSIDWAKEDKELRRAEKLRLKREEKEDELATLTNDIALLKQELNDAIRQSDQEETIEPALNENNSQAVNQLAVDEPTLLPPAETNRSNVIAPPIFDTDVFDQDENITEEEVVLPTEYIAYPDLTEEKLTEELKSEPNEEIKIEIKSIVSDQVAATAKHLTKPLEIPAAAFDHRLAAQPDLNSAKQSTSGFGTSFPINPKKGDTFIRVDYLPSKLFKWNDATWIEISKANSETYAYNEQYIKHLVDQIATGECDVTDLSELEQEQVQTYLTKTANERK